MKLFGLIASANAMLRTSSPECAEVGKPNFCKDVLTYTTRTNSWTCKDCFNIRVEVNLNAIGAVGDYWDNRDHVFLAFDNDVSFIKVAGPGDNVVQLDRDDDGNQVWRVDFQSTFNPGDRRIDINIEFKEADAPSNLVKADLCPFCFKDTVVADPCDSSWLVANVDEVSEPSQGEWNCAKVRKFEKMNRCQFVCNAGTPEEYSAGGFAKCFRYEDHKKFSNGWMLPKNRELSCDN
ncbi:Oidioi.mRNA.OKI2018_I69.PAR.g9031.t1.cds [Oikopleura dioica]|uniref:Oidioi.mRNA.OKI2018_I69.PAR.g9031.t1.cds n=1 Tax=Oikopleura dioica TaxID=34765 RepID=A0ABN7RIP0_OIKDI|nr:Oidioi.mRNA.OKI2018_I69.PAR.g9031.t1.cds [Oikopleura dioica]